MAFEYGEQRDANGNVTHQGSWSAKSNPKECIDAVIENFRVIKDEELSNKVDKNGNVASATKLATARKINGVIFDGTTDITITDDTKSPATHTHNYAGSSSAGGVANSAKDSDTVDGKHATDFAPSGFGLGGEVTLVKSGSANSIVDTGFYNVTPDVTDLPKTGCYYYMIVMRHKSVNPTADTSRCTKQVAYSLQPAKDGTNIYERTQYEGVWTIWKQIATTSNRGNLSFDVDNAYSFGDSAHRATQLFSASATINTSDRNAKKDIETTSLGLDFISKLNPVEFKYKIKENKVEQAEDGFETIEIPAEYDDDGNMIKEATTEERPKYKEVISAIPGVRTHVGLIAQEVEEALDGRDVAIFTKDENGYGLRYEELVAPLIKAIQELTLKVNKLENKLTERAE